jgi:hypothetical protein
MQRFLVNLLRVEGGDDKVGLQQLHDRNNQFLQSCYRLSLARFLRRKATVGAV